MPPISGFLTTLIYLFPFVGDILRPALVAKGRRVKRQLKAKFRAVAREAERDADRDSAQ